MSNGGPRDIFIPLMRCDVMQLWPANLAGQFFKAGQIKLRLILSWGWI